MTRIQDILAAASDNPANVKYSELCRLCDHYFGKPRQKGTRHRVYKMPWQGDSKVNIQKKGNRAKPYQVKQVINAVNKLDGLPMANKDHYTYRITWSDEDQEFVGLCAEFPSLNWLDESPLAALAGIIDLVASCITDMLQADEKVPKPIADRKYSGKFMVRVPGDTHRALALKAAENGTSINRIVSEKLAQV